jgi:beta-glucanase (GH16 family)
MRFQQGIHRLLLVLAILTACSTPTAIPATPTPAPTSTSESPGWELVWQDEFDGPTLNPEYWIAETGAGGWGNNELQYYTDRPENLRLQDGQLIIEALQEDYHGSDYTSARIKTQYLQSWTYGRIEARMKLPTGKGVWSAFWMLGEDFATKGWPGCGEIDIMENIGEAHRTYGTVHGPGYSGGNGIGSSVTVSGETLNDSYHVYAIEWIPGQINWFLDDRLFFQISNTEVPDAWVFDHSFFIILNLAIGGNWPGYPDESTEFPQQLLVDYVRVYRDPTLEVIELQEGDIHVADITMDLEDVSDTWQAMVYVTVVDQDGNPVEGITVKAGWLGVVVGSDESAITNENGIAGPLRAKKNKITSKLTFCVNDLFGDRYTYLKDSNEETCVSVEP